MKKINEEFLHFLWKNQHLAGVTFHTGNTFDLKVLDPGIYNTDAGPDFFNARVEIDRTIWAGNVELHINASDWLKHGHGEDPAYDSVIMHVVYFNDCVITRPDGQVIPTAILRFPHILWDKYTGLHNDNSWLPCSRDLRNVSSLVRTQWISAMVVEKLEAGTGRIEANFNDLKGHWDAILCRSLLRAFGIPVNTVPFELLSLVLPYIQLLRNKDDLFTLEALLFGQSGMLEKVVPNDIYTEHLKREFSRHCGKFKNGPVPLHLWKFMRMRPSSFPTIRLAFFAALVHNHFPLHEQLEKLPPVSRLRELFRVQAGDYWNTHYTFGKESTPSVKHSGNSFIDLILINSISPYLFFYGQQTKSQRHMDYAIRLLELIPPENNRILKKWGKFGIAGTNAFESQGILHLYKEYCQGRKCLQCQFGNQLIIHGRTTV